ncbi:mirror-image polydactyly gene 1 protein isoform X2 [Hippoglossus hippoglossus]|uniref:mirror-image polydactyly gene 1 protein isoform X2 n=1 Tax=Hippoglossus hippoglossus TaxID=8267 RepID=UPI00148BE453|nr:mirror-image polydactyly gene 1 protein isoform X2 [Hippoglossus hippoglossus]
MERDMSPSRGPSPRVESCRDAHDGVQRGPGSPVLRRHVETDDSFHHDVVIGRVQSFDRDKNISFLLKELDTVRRTNHRLQAELLQKDKELERRRFEEELRKEERERPAVVLEEVWSAQKDRDQALMSRLLLANEERDEALLHASRLLQAAELEKINLDDTNMDVDELLQCVCDADSAQEVEEFGSVLVQRLRLAQQRRSDITAQEMKAVMEERDGSVAKDELLRRQTERGGAVDDRRRLEAELQALRANHSPSPLLFHDEDSRVSPPEARPVSVQMQQLSKEKQSVEAELQRCQEAEREANERVRRLERLVEVLRKKVGTGSVRAVI